MRAIVFFLEFGIPLILAFAAGIAATLYTQRYLRKRDANLRDELTQRERIASLSAVTTKELLEEISTRDDIPTEKDS